MINEEHPQRTILETCDLWDTDYISDNWEQQSEHSQWPLNNEWQGQHSQFLQCFFYTNMKREKMNRIMEKFPRTQLG